MLVIRCNAADSIEEVIELNDLSDDDANHILDMWADNQPAYIGECEYKPFEDA